VSVIAQTPSARARRAAQTPGARAQERRGLLPAIAGLGAGGHAKCTVEAIRSVLRYRVVALLDSDPSLQGRTVLGCPVMGGDALAVLRAQGVELAFVGIGGAGDAAPRRTAASLLRDAGFRLPAIVHRAASVAVSAALEEGAQVMAGAIVNAEARIGRDALVNAGAIVGHDVVAGECSHIASGARLGGGVVVGAGAHIGSGAVVLQGRTVGEGAIVGAGAVVIDDVAPGVRMGGVPARPLTSPRTTR
jgi:sugar O-acyltransferase (sialic acid O-acetyltransferase NeuD family)